MADYTTVIMLDETGCYLAWHPDLPGAMSDGHTPDEARENLKEAAQMILDHLRACDLPIPEPHVSRSGDVLTIDREHLWLNV